MSHIGQGQGEDGLEIRRAPGHHLADVSAGQSTKEGRHEGAAPGGHQRIDGRDQGRESDTRKLYNCTVLLDVDDTHSARVFHDTVPITIRINNYSLTDYVLVSTGQFRRSILIKLRRTR